MVYYSQLYHSHHIHAFKFLSQPTIHILVATKTTHHNNPTKTPHHRLKSPIFPKSYTKIWKINCVMGFVECGIRLFHSPLDLIKPHSRMRNSMHLTHNNHLHGNITIKPTFLSMVLRPSRTLQAKHHAIRRSKANLQNLAWIISKNYRTNPHAPREAHANNQLTLCDV